MSFDTSFKNVKLVSTPFSTGVLSHFPTFTLSHLPAPLEAKGFPSGLPFYSAISKILHTRSSKLIPLFAAAWGRRLVAVIPGMVLSSRR